MSVALVHELRSPTASAQMMGHGMMGGGMMGGSNGNAMGEVMAWMQGRELAEVPTAPEPAATKELLANGREVYDARCAVCHGEHGDGKGPQADKLDPVPRDFTRGVYAFRSTPSGSLPTDEDIWKTISDGLHGTAMVPWVSLSERDRWALVAYLKTFSASFSAKPAGKSIAIPATPAVTPKLVAEGKTLYKDAGCVSCHGTEGRGDGTSAPELKDVAGHPIKATDFTKGPFRRGSTMSEFI
ncbi:MAG TPA: c-type cytochrome [Candidatus Binataceae bacterium]|nr:c-type cytochrome [Candidatus Binataceae bacterium]